jgi:threonine/homoserine/homoserine lactone efflux protein
VSQGVKAGFAAALGISAGCYVHIFAAALGLSALLAASSAAFTIIKYAGAAYLVYVGLTLLRAKPASAQSVVPIVSLGRIFAQGFLTNVLNPKVALFFLAFVPQFIDPSATNKPLAFLFLGGVFNFNGTLWCLFLAWVTARLGSVGIGRRATAWLSRSVAVVFVCLGVRLALARQS